MKSKKLSIVKERRDSVWPEEKDFYTYNDDFYKDKVFVKTSNNISIDIYALKKSMVITNCKFNGRVTITNPVNKDGYNLIFIDCDFHSLEIYNTKSRMNAVEFVTTNGLYTIGEFFVQGINTIRLSNQQISVLNIQASGKGIVAGFEFNNCKIDSIKIDAQHSSILPTLDNLVFKDIEFTDISGFKEVNFEQKIEFINPVFTIVNDDTHAIFRSLKHSFSSNSNDFLSNMFAGYELKSKFNGSHKTENLTETVLNYFYYWINDFGLDKYRPIYILAGICFLVLAGTGSIHDAVVFIAGPSRVLTKDFDYLTICNSLGRFGLSALSGILWIFIVLGIRKRFKIDG